MKTAPKKADPYDWGTDDIEEDIQSEHDHNDKKGGYLVESGGQYGITVSQSLGIDPSVDSLALDDYDHIETVEL